MAMIEATGKTTKAKRNRERLEYRALVAVSFVPCLLVAATARLAGSDAKQSMFTEALSSARAAAGYAFLM